MNKSYRETSTGEVDMFLECKGIMTMIYDSVMRLEYAYKSGNQQRRHECLKLFKRYKDFYVGQIENNGFCNYEKKLLIKEMIGVCKLILSHNRDYYTLMPAITKQTQHYIVRLTERLDKLEGR